MSSFNKAFVHFSSRPIELILKQFLNYQAEENPCCFFFPGAFNIKLVNSFILLSSPFFYL